MRACVTVVLLLTLLGWVLPAAAQTTLGYKDPADTSNLLEYRLPDWTFRTWDADFALQGGGAEARNSGIVGLSNSFSSRLGTNFRQAWESEVRDLTLTGALNGDYRRAHSGREDAENKSRALRGAYRLGASGRYYLGSGPLSLGASVYSDGNYTEDVRETRLVEDWSDITNIRRQTSHELEGSLGVGRVRNVVPLLRAQRLSERLMTLGREALSGAQVQEVARVLAKEYGYREVFDRSDRHFWDDVLAPMLDPDNPLSTLEVFYLTDVLNEAVGNRLQGWQVQAWYRYRERNRSGGSEDTQNRSLSPQASVVWAHNFSLTQQLRLSGRWGYYWAYSGAYSQESTTHGGTGEYLWNLTDRYTWTTVMFYDSDAMIDDSASRAKVAGLETNFRVWVEDQVSLYAGVNGQYRWTARGDDETLSWNWGYRMGLEYHLDRWLF